MLEKSKLRLVKGTYMKSHSQGEAQQDFPTPT